MIKIYLRPVIFLVLSISLMLAGCGGGSWNSTTLVSIAVTPANPSIAAGTTQQFIATGTLSNNTTQDLTAIVTWSSSDTSTAIISNTAGSHGMARAIAVGTSTVTATVSGISGTTTLTVTPATLQSIAVTPTNPSIAAGTTKQFAATGLYSDNTTQDLTSSVVWSSTDSSKATISNTAGTNGLATSVVAGTTTITAVSGTIFGTTTLTVTSATLQSIAVTPVTPSIAAGTTQQFTAIGTYTDSTTQDLTTSVVWTSSVPARASISAAGMATTGISTGITTITATSGLISGATDLTVTSATLVSIAVTPATASISVNPAGTSQQFTAIGTFSDSSTQNLTSSVTWSSSSPSVATISNIAGSNGLASTVAAGSTTITATSGLISGTANLTVTSATLVSIAVTPISLTVAVNATVPYTATGTYSNGTTQNLTALVTWSSSTPAVAVISNAAGSKGLATAVALGSTNIKATSGLIVSPNMDLEVE